MASVSLHLEWAQPRPCDFWIRGWGSGGLSTFLNHKFQYRGTGAEPETAGRKVLGSPIMLMLGPPGGALGVTSYPSKW